MLSTGLHLTSESTDGSSGSSASPSAAKRPLETSDQSLRAAGMVEDVAVEQFDPLIAGGPDLRDRTADIERYGKGASKASGRRQEGEHP